MINWLKRLIRGDLYSGRFAAGGFVTEPYDYGICFVNDQWVHARRLRYSGRVQFILWKAGENGHDHNYWHDIHQSHWRYFNTNPIIYVRDDNLPLPTITTVYLAGPVSGKPNGNAKQFSSAAERLTSLGYRVLYTGMVQGAKMSEQAWMDIGMAMIRDCDMVMMLDGWKESTGSLAEYHYAQKCGKPINSVQHLDKMRKAA